MGTAAQKNAAQRAAAAAAPKVPRKKRVPGQPTQFEKTIRRRMKAAGKSSEDIDAFFVDVMSPLPNFGVATFGEVSQEDGTATPNVLVLTGAMVERTGFKVGESYQWKIRRQKSGTKVSVTITLSEEETESK